MDKRLTFPLVVAVVMSACAANSLAAETVRLTGEIVDAESGAALPARLYIEDTNGQPYWAKSSSPQGSAVEYRRQRMPNSGENHTTLSAHGFVADLPPGRYRLTAERGKEYLPTVATITVENQPTSVVLKLKRWTNMAEQGWFSGDTHVHRSLEELPNIIAAEDLNVALPLTNWVTTAYTPPATGNKNASADFRRELIEVDRTHVIYPVNTEYEIFSVGDKRHTLGAVFVLNHQTPLKQGVPPVKPVAEEARRQGAILDMDKHSWPWSMMIVPVMNVDLFELANNHVWRTEFAFHSWTLDTNPAYLQVETNDEGFTERGWIDYGFGTYYALLNCGFRLRPTAGTGSGVHPVPLGFGRVYVELPDGFNYADWMKNLNAGRSFVTTGPMLFVKVNGQPPGHIFQNVTTQQPTCRVTGAADSIRPLDRIEIIVNGELRQTIRPQNQRRATGGFHSSIDTQVDLDGSSWLVVRCFDQQPDGRFRFAHSSPVHFEVDGQPLRPRMAEVGYLIARMQEELKRNADVLKPAELDEYREALRIYQDLAKTAR